MNIVLKGLLPAVVSCGLMANICAARNISDEATAIQAIRQAPDPSATVAAFASGSAQLSEDPKLIDAYMQRMIDLGVPEMAYHQAQTLAKLDPRNGLAWAVVAYVDARRNDMPAAITAIEKAARYSPENAFVDRTSGGIVAWADSTAGQASLPPSQVSTLANVKSLVGSRPDFTSAYNAAKQAYAGTAPGLTPEPAAPAPQTEVTPGSAASAYPPATYPDYSYYSPDDASTVLPEGDGYSYYDGPYYDGSGPGPWWEPPGYFYGSFFVPGPFFVFGAPGFFGHHHHDGFFEHHGFDHDRFIAHGGFDHRGLDHRGFGFAGRGAFRSGGTHFGANHAWTHSPATIARPGLHAWTSPSPPHFIHHGSGGFHGGQSLTASPHFNHGAAGGFHGTAGHGGGFHSGAMGGGGFHGGGGMTHGGGSGGGGHGGGGHR